MNSAFGEAEEERMGPQEKQDLQNAGHVRRHYIISGRVQEVGFRYTAYYIAEELKLSGWVANLPDGNVEMELQGRPETIDTLLCRLDGNGRIVIDTIEEEDRPLQRACGFKVRG